MASRSPAYDHHLPCGAMSPMTRSLRAMTTADVTSGMTQRSQRSCRSSVSRSERSNRSPAANDRQRENVKAPTVRTSHRRQRETALKPKR